MKISARWLLGSTAVYLFPVVAMAADLPSHRQAPAPAALIAYDWTGAYFGAQVGGQQFQDKTPVGSPRGSAVFGGVHAGYNKQFGALVMGFEGDLELAAPAHVRTNVSENGFEWRNGLVQGSLRARFGFAVDRALFYVTGGAAFISGKTDYSTIPAVGASHSLAGWTLGGGLDYAVTNDWSARAEYRYASFGKYTDTLPGLISVQHTVTSQAVRVGLSYHFITK